MPSLKFITQMFRHHSTFRWRWGRILLCLTMLFSLTVVGAAVIAPLQFRWAVARSAELAYRATSQDSEPGTGPVPDHVINIHQARDQLISACGSAAVVKVEQPNCVIPAAFAFENPTHPESVKFQKATRDLVPTPFDVLEVARRIRALSPHRLETDPTTDLQTALLAARQGRGLVCVHFTRLLASICAVNGYPSRIISATRDGCEFEHAVCEVFLPEFNKWVVIDTDYLIAYQRNGILLNAYEIQQAWQQVRSNTELLDTDSSATEKQQRIFDEIGVELVSFGETENNFAENKLEISSTGMNLEYYEYIFIAHRNDYLSSQYPMLHPLRVGQTCFRVDGRNSLQPTCPEADYQPYESIYASVDATWIEVDTNPRDCTVDLRFTTCTPGFAGFEIRKDKHDWQTITDWDRHRWQLHAGHNELEVRSVDSVGLSGPASRISVDIPSTLSVSSDAR